MFVIRLLNDMKIKKKLAVTFISVAVIPLLLCGLFLTAKLRQVVVEDAFEQVSANVERVRKRTEELLNVPADISNRLINDKRMKKAAGQQYDNAVEVIEAYRGYTDIRDYLQMYKEISSIRVYVDNPSILENWEFMQANPEISSQKWYREALEEKGLIGWNQIEDGQSRSESLNLIRSFPLLSFRQKGVMVIRVDKRHVDSILEQESFLTLIVDSQNRIVASNAAGISGKDFLELSASTRLLDLQEGSYDVTLDGKASKAIVANLRPQDSWNGLRTLSVFTVSEITRDADHVIFLGTVVIVISLIFAALLTYASASLLSGRLRRLSRHVTEVHSGSWKTFLPIDGSDEIGMLSRQFNALVHEVNRLFETVQETSRQKNLVEQRQNEMKFKMLASQINPHFLFNSLESIRMEAHIRKQDGIAEAVWKLSKLLRSSIETGSGRITLGKELEHVRCYLDIQQFRYEERLQYRLDVGVGQEDIQIPPFIIQPLVENAIVHGLDSRAECVFIEVRVGECQGGILVEVRDNGAGIPTERLESLRRELTVPAEEAEEQRIGLRNVNDRLILLYGAASALKIDSQPGCGMRIEFFVPGGEDQ